MAKKRVEYSYKGERIGLFAMDPGSTTGIAYAPHGILLEGTTKEVFERDPLEVMQFKCIAPDLPPHLSEVRGAVEIADLYRSTVADWILDGIPYTRHFFVFEDFNLRGNPGSLDRTGISPVRVTSLLMGLLHGHPKVWIAQSPEQAKSTWTADRLKRAGLWVRGKPHGRDAVRHAALFAKKNL